MTGTAAAGAPAEDNARVWAMAAHLATLANFGFPLGGLVIAILVFAARQHDGPIFRENVRSALNAQITLALFNGVVFLVALCMFASIFVTFGFVANHRHEAVQAFPWQFAAYASCFVLLAAGNALVAILGAVGARAVYLGRVYRYPIAIPFVRATAARAV